MFHARRLSCRASAAVLVAALSAPAVFHASAPDTPDTADATLFRVFLTNGTSLTSYGELARVGDRVVFSMPIAAGSPGAPQLHLVNLPANLVDWANTERYADSARYTHYVKTRGDADYAALNNQIASVLAEINAAKEPGRRLELALGARRMLVEWPKDHYGYRSHDIVQISGILDEVISELRAETGGTAFDLTFVATVSPPALLPAAAPPTDQEMVEQALAAAHSADSAADRMSLLDAIAAALAPKGAPPEPWRATTYSAVVRELDGERATDAAYARVATELTKSAARYARLADVVGVQRVLTSVGQRDRALGGRRPEQVHALTRAIEVELEGAQRLRLAWDRWEMRLPDLRKYGDSASDLLQGFEASRWKIEQIQQLAGPSDAVLARLTRTCETVAYSIRAITPPSELTSAHALALSAIDLAAAASRLRREAIRSGNLETARDASSAAAGALMLMARARADIEAQLKRPQPR